MTVLEAVTNSHKLETHILGSKFVTTLNRGGLGVYNTKKVPPQVPLCCPLVLSTRTRNQNFSTSSLPTLAEGAHLIHEFLFGSVEGSYLPFPD